MLKKIWKCIASFVVLCIACCFVNTKAGAVDGAEINIVAEISIHSFGDWLIKEMGHSFLAIKNTSSRGLYVGKKYVPKGTTVTIGNWGNMKQHIGLWYNLEQYTTTSYEIVSLHSILSDNELDTLNEYILEHDWWTWEYNCTTFAAEAWNLNSSYKFYFSDTPYPIDLCNKMKSYSTYQKNVDLDISMASGYFNGNTFVQAIGIRA